ncbi:MAG: hypothetical protein OXG72_06175 [Acidobacteria bacterium]|nr:hypothetical protein [Acidobacteriota bacterium]
MTTTRDRLLALRAKAHRRHVEFERRKYNKRTVSRVVNATIALMALATAAAEAIEMPGGTGGATIAFATVLLIASIVNLTVSDTERDRDLYRLSDAWGRHRTDATRLLARNDIQRPADTAEKIQNETAELECRIAETHTDSLLHDGQVELTPSRREAPRGTTEKQ